MNPSMTSTEAFVTSHHSVGGILPYRRLHQVTRGRGCCQHSNSSIFLGEGCIFLARQARKKSATGENRTIAIESQTSFLKAQSGDCCLDIEEKYILTDEEGLKLIREICQVTNAPELQSLGKSTRDSYLKQLKEQYHLSIRQIQRLTGINRGVIFKA